MKTEPKTNPCQELLFLAEENGDYDEFKELLEAYGVRGTTPPAGKTGEIYAYDLEHALLRIPPHRYDAKVRVVALLLTYNLSKRQISHALSRAVSKSQIQTVRLLLDHGANPNHLNDAAAAGDLDAIDALIAAGADINLATKAVSLAAENGRTKTLQILIELGFPFDLRTLRYPALISNNPATIEAVRKLGAQFTGEDLDDEDLQECHKTIAYLRSLGLQPTDPEID
jgi:ankyrin repeat protein